MYLRNILAVTLLTTAATATSLTQAHVQCVEDVWTHGSLGLGVGSFHFKICGTKITKAWVNTSDVREPRTTYDNGTAIPGILDLKIDFQRISSPTNHYVAYSYTIPNDSWKGNVYFKYSVSAKAPSSAIHGYVKMCTKRDKKEQTRKNC